LCGVDCEYLSAGAHLRLLFPIDTKHEAAIAAFTTASQVFMTRPQIESIRAAYKVRDLSTCTTQTTATTANSVKLVLGGTWSSNQHVRKQRSQTCGLRCHFVTIWQYGSWHRQFVI